MHRWPRCCRIMNAEAFARAIGAPQVCLATCGCRFSGGRPARSARVRHRRKKLLRWSRRHTHASLLIHGGVHPKAIQARLGHASITTTLNTYGHPMEGAFQGVGERLDGLLYGTRTAPNAAEAAAKP